MGAENEGRNESTQTNNAIPPQYSFPQYAAGNVQPVMYVPQTVQFSSPVASVSVNDSEMESLVQKQQWGCKRRWGGCCWKDDGRPLGTFQNFVVSVFFGTISPVLSILTMYGMETSKLSRNGVIFGTANAFFILASILLFFSRHDPGSISHFHIIVPFLLGLIILIVAVKSFRHFLYIYTTRQNKTEEELVRVISQVGSCKEFLATFFLSLFIPVIGTSISLIARRRYLYGRYGALSGLGFFLVLAGVWCAFMGHPPISLVIGLFLMQFSFVHFRRAIICAQANQSASIPTSA